MEQRPVEISDVQWLEAAQGSDLQRVVTSAQVRDRAGRLVIQAGWDLANYLANPVVLWAHDADRLPVGRAVNLEVAEHRGIPSLLSDIQFFDAAQDEFAAKVGSLMAAGDLRAMSAGWLGLETKAAFDEEGDFVGTDFHRSELVEQSVVPVPSNPAAVKAAMALELHREELEAVFLDLPNDVAPKRVHVDMKPEPAPRISAAFRAKLAAESARVRALNRTKH